MLNTLAKKIITEENVKKDFKKLANYIIKAKGNDRSIKGFAADCETGYEYMESVIKGKINCYPQLQFLKVVSDNSEGRVSFKDLTIACGYSNYANNDMEQIKNIYVRRGWFVYADFGDRGIDSETNGKRLVLIIPNDAGNTFGPNSITLNVTSRRKKSLPTHVLINGKECGLPYDSTISCELPDTISKRRLISKSGVVEKVSECPIHIMQKVEVCLAKATGIIALHVKEAEAIETLTNMNKGITRTYQFDNNRNQNTVRQSVFA